MNLSGRRSNFQSDLFNDAHRPLERVLTVYGAYAVKFSRGLMGRH